MGLILLLVELFKWLMVGMMGFSALLFLITGVVTFFTGGEPQWWICLPTAIVAAGTAFGFSQMETK